jgi:hypothetical protein
MQDVRYQVMPAVHLQAGLGAQFAYPQSTPTERLQASLQFSRRKRKKEKKRQARLTIKLQKMATPEGIEPPTHCLEGSCSIP